MVVWKSKTRSYYVRITHAYWRISTVWSDQLTETNGAPFTLYSHERTQGRAKAHSATQNASQKSLADKNKEVRGKNFSVLFQGK